jgi:hypothetical protein
MVRYVRMFVLAVVAFPAIGRAASLEVSGIVAVNRVPVTGTVPVAIGDSIMVAPGARAQILYDNGCRENVAPGTVDYVKGDGSLKDGPICAAGTGPGSTSAANAASSSASGAGASGAGAAGSGASAASVAAGAAVIGLAGFGAYKLGRNRPASP